MIETTWNLFFDGWIIAIAATCAVACEEVLGERIS